MLPDYTPMMLQAPAKGVSKNHSKAYGQFFTPKHVADFMVSLITKDHDSRILEPCSGKGVFLDSLIGKGFQNITAFEIDSALICESHPQVINQSFLKHSDMNCYDVVIGNPPYIRWKNLNKILKEELKHNATWAFYFNNLCDYLFIFIYLSVLKLKDQGELIFITPEYWFNTKHAEFLRSFLSQNGYFQWIFHFNETPFFEKVTSSYLVFKYIKGSQNKHYPNCKVVKYQGYKNLSLQELLSLKSSSNKKGISVFSRSQFKDSKGWYLLPDQKEESLLKFEEKCNDKFSNLLPGVSFYSTVADIADIGNGMVSGLDKVFQIPSVEELTPLELASVLKVVKAKDLYRYFPNGNSFYMFLNKKVSTEDVLKRNYPNFYKLLKPFEKDLNKRYKYSNFLPYWEWAFPRSYNLFSNAKALIFVPCKERVSNKDFFRFCYIQNGYYPTQDVTALVLKKDTKESIYFVLAYLNSQYVFDWLNAKGVRKGNIIEFSEKPIASIPFKRINWSDKDDVLFHQKVTVLTKALISQKLNTFENINSLFYKYFSKG